MGVLASPGTILNAADSVHRLLSIVLFTYIFKTEQLTPNKGNLSRVKCASIVLMSNAFITGNNHRIYVFTENLLMITVNYLLSHSVVIPRVD